jgi:signal transduction histidine kinase
MISGANTKPLRETERMAVAGRDREMEQRIRSFDWAKTPLGAIERWPQSLRTVVNILLSSRYAMWMAWGPELTMLYNDAYRPTLGIKHPWALGQRANTVWAEIWPDIGPRVEAVLTTGQATYDEGLLLFLERSGFPEETYHTFSYSPLLDDDSRINGLLCVVTEETDRLIGERRVQTLREVSSALASTHTEDQVLQAVSEQLDLNKKDLPFTLTYLFDDSGNARLAFSSGITVGHPLAPAWISRDSNPPWPVEQMRLQPLSRLIESLAEQSRIGPLPAGDWNKPVEQAAIVPIKQQGQDEPAGAFIVGTNPYRRYDSAYSGFVTLLSGQLAAGLGNARAYEAERRRAEALAEIDRAKTTFFSNVSHELRTPLTLMLSPIEELLANHPERREPEERDLLDLVHRNGLRLQKLVNTLLDFSRIEAGRMQATYEPTDLAHYTTDLASNFSSAMQRAGLNFKVECQALPQPVYIDREMWEKIVLNLLSNALKFTFEGSVTVTLRPGPQVAVLTVEDTGIGIAKAELPHIFERFHRGAEAEGRTIEGTGIGLALVQELVKMHGGSITVTSELGSGSTFTVVIPEGTEHLPKEKVKQKINAVGSTTQSRSFVTEALRWLSDGSTVPTEESSNQSSQVFSPLADFAPSQEERVLLADDNADVREYVSRLLGRQYRVVTVSNGDDALKAALADPPDLILSDVMMPGLDGFQLLAELRGRPATATIPVILLSARAGEESRVEGLGAGADDYLIKPFTARELLARVGAHLSMSRRRKEAEQALRETQETLQSFYDSCPFLMGVAEIQGEDIIQVYSNAATAAFFGAPEREILNCTAEELGVPAEITAFWLQRYRESQAEGRSVRFEYAHPRPGGDCWLSACVNFLGYNSAGSTRFSFIFEDITERKKNDERLRQSNIELRRANSDLEQFAYSASHDLKEPLRQVAVYSQLLEKKFADKLDGKASQYLGYCIEGAHRMEMLISDLLTYSQATKTSDASEPVSMNEVVETAKKNLATSIEETAAEIFTTDLPAVQANSVPLVHLLQNLISNALKYRSDKKPRLRISADEEGDYWRFSIQDNGIGIAKEFQSQIFGIFKRLHNRSEYPGTGIGLAICQKVVEQYGGRIWVESEPGRGSTFFFTLPRASE